MYEDPRRRVPGGVICCIPYHTSTVHPVLSTSRGPDAEILDRP